MTPSLDGLTGVFGGVIEAKWRGADTAGNSADAIFENIFNHQEPPYCIVSDPDSKFRSDFWESLKTRSLVQLNMWSFLHQQTYKTPEIKSLIVELH